MSEQILQNLAKMLQSPDLASKKWISQQYDSQVMNDTIQTNGDASVVRVHGTKKALAISTDCTPRYVEADPFEGAKQAVAETYRNISAVGGKPLAITNCLNFGNPQKPEIMGQIVRAIKGITEASQILNYPVISGNVSLYNETDGKAIQPTPAIGGVGLLKDLEKRSCANFKEDGDEIYIIGKTLGHIDCSIFEREILNGQGGSNPPPVNLQEERRNGNLVQELIERSIVRSCHDISDGGLLVALFEMCFRDFVFDVDIKSLRESIDVDIDINNILFGEDQARYIVTVDPSFFERFEKRVREYNVEIFKIGNVVKGDQIKVSDGSNAILQGNITQLQKINEELIASKVSQGQ